MANSEEAVLGLDELLREEFPTFLAQVQALFTDGVELPNLKSFTWEETPDWKGLDLPGVQILAQDETDPSLRDQLFDCHVTLLFAVGSPDKRRTTKIMFRYGRALRRMVKTVTNRGLRGKVNSVKVGTIRWLPGYAGSSQSTIFSRQIAADMVVRLPREGD